MSRDNRYMPSLRGTLLGGAAVVGLLAAGAPALAVQDSAGSDDVVVVTGTRIQSPNVVSSSPVTSVSEVELEFQQEANIERIFRNLPATIPGDGQNVNNGTVGAASIDLRGLGTNRSLILVDGKRLTPYSLTGIIDTQTIPVNMLERVDVVTGGASAVYGSDAMSGAVNFILKDDFEGVELSYEGRASEQSDGEQHHIGVLLGTNLNDGSGNVTASLGYTQRMGVQFGDRPFGLVGVSTTNGSAWAARRSFPASRNARIRTVSTKRHPVRRRPSRPPSTCPDRPCSSAMTGRSGRAVPSSTSTRSTITRPRRSASTSTSTGATRSTGISSSTAGRTSPRPMSNSRSRHQACSAMSSKCR